MGTKQEHQLSKAASQAFGGGKKQSSGAQENYFNLLERIVEKPIDPNKWLEEYVRSHGTMKARLDVISLIRLYPEGSLNKTCIFYKNALGYLKNKYYNGTFPQNATQG